MRRSPSCFSPSHFLPQSSLLLLRLNLHGNRLSGPTVPPPFSDEAKQGRATQIETPSRPSRALHLHLGHPPARVEDELLPCLRQLCAPSSAACLPRPQGGCVGVASDNAKAPSRPSRALCLHQVAHPSKWRTSSSSTASRSSSSPRTHPQPRSIARSEPARRELHRGTDPISAP